jgi:predicted nucleotide-binding protein (sugar kinase/HSP70/actin superfamily)
MKIMLPYYNDLTVFLSTIFDELGFEIDYLGRPSKESLELATKYSPESWCFDAKIMLGQCLEGIKRGNNILCMPGAWGGAERNCFVGYLTRGAMQKKLEKITKKKINMWFFNVNPAEIMMSAYTSAYKNLAELKKYSKISFFRSRIIKASLLATKKMNLTAKIKDIILNSPDVVEKEKLFKVHEDVIKEMIYNAKTKKQADEIFECALTEIKNMKRKKIRRKIKIGIVGDYAHTLFSQQPFFDIEKFILSEDVSINQPLSFASYYNFLSPVYTKKNRNDLKKIFPQNVSGSDGVTLLCSFYLKDKVDGLIHIRTFGCMPEEVANEVLTTNKNMFPPILSLSYDAHTTEENLKVRIEAFIDMLRR